MGTPQEAKPARRGPLLLVIVATAVLLVVIGVALTDRNNHETRPAPAPRAVETGAVPDGPPTLAPARFSGKVAQAYQVAKEIPEVLREIYCYCKCDVTVGHRHLLDCYRDDHAAG